MSALQSSGAITLAQIQSEFGGSNPISMSEYYRGGSFVPSHSGTTGIPSSGQIGMNMFYGKQDESPVPSTWSATITVGLNIIFNSYAYGFSTYILTYGSVSDNTPTVGTQLDGSSNPNTGTVLTSVNWGYDSKALTSTFGVNIHGKQLTQSAFSRITFGSFNLYTSNATFTSGYNSGDNNYYNTWRWAPSYSQNYSPKSGAHTVTLYQ